MSVKVKEKATQPRPQKPPSQTTQKKFVKLEKFCKVCEDDIFFDHYDDKWKMRIEETHWNHYEDGFDYQDIRINFCYQCGKDYQKV